MSTVEQTLTGTWQSDAVHSSAGFEIKHMVVSTFRANLSEFDATLTIEDGGSAKLEGSGPVAGIKTSDPNLDAHLLAPDFFDAERNPTLSFESTSVRLDGDNVTAQGNLSAKGQTLPLELRGTIAGPVTDPYGKERLGLELSGEIDRTTYGLDFNAPPAERRLALSNDVKLVAHLELVKA